jgi:hypothetical protein
MQKEHIYYAIIGVAVLTVIVAVALYSWPERKPPPPPVLEQRILGDADDTVKKEAARDLAYHGNAARQEIRRSFQKYDGGNVEVKISLIDATGQTRDWQSIPELFKEMESPVPAVRASAANAVQRIMGLDFGYRADDPPEKRAEVVAQMREEYEEMKKIGRFREFYGDQGD